MRIIYDGSIYTHTYTQQYICLKEYRHLTCHFFLIYKTIYIILIYLLNNFKIFSIHLCERNIFYYRKTLRFLLTTDSVEILSESYAQENIALSIRISKYFLRSNLKGWRRFKRGKLQIIIWYQFNRYMISMWIAFTFDLSNPFLC